MPWYIAVEILYIFIFIVFADCIVLNPVNWNASNPICHAQTCIVERGGLVKSYLRQENITVANLQAVRTSDQWFKVSNNDHVIEVNMEDQIDFSCPHYPDGTNAEYYVIYKVSKASYDRCVLDANITKDQMVVNCSKPNARRRRTYTVTITSFSPIPGAPEFTAGASHYFITTSTGTVHGMNNPYQGACHFKNMKLSIKVCCESTTAASNKTTTAALPSNSPTSLLSSSSTISTTSTPSGGEIPPGDKGSSSTNAASTTINPPTASPSTATRSTSTTRSTTTKNVKWRTTRKYTDDPVNKSTKKTSDKDNGENDTIPKTIPQTGGTISLRTNSITSLQLMVLLLTNCFTVLLLTNR